MRLQEHEAVAASKTEEDGERTGGLASEEDERDEVKADG